MPTIELVVSADVNDALDRECLAGSAQTLCSHMNVPCQNDHVNVGIHRASVRHLGAEVSQVEVQIAVNQ